MRLKTALVFLGAATLAASAFAQTKASGTALCKSEPFAPVPVDETAGQAFGIGKAQCTWTKMEIGGVPYKTGVSISMDEIEGDKVTSTGNHVATLANGDKTNARFQGTSTTKDGKLLSASGTWTFRSGTGKLKGIKGGGTFKGTPNADGTVTYQIEGQYSMP